LQLPTNQGGPDSQVRRAPEEAENGQPDGPQNEQGEIYLMADGPTLPTYPKPQPRPAATLPHSIPVLSHPKQGAPLQKMIGKMFKGKIPKVGLKRSPKGQRKRKNQVNFY